jgi:membrane associated rhomboid family serine protease
MSWINRLERRLEPYAVTNLTLFLVIGQTFVLLTSMLQLIDPALLVLAPAFALAGEWWRIVSFVFIPPNQGPLFTAFALYLLYLYGTALERHWGALRYNLFLLTGWALTVGFSFLTPYSIATNIFIGGSVFLAFAWLHPNFELLLFFVLPVKIKWLALLAWLGYAYTFFMGGLSTKLGVVAAVGNFILFFGGDLWRAAFKNRPRANGETLGRSSETRQKEARHTCSVCSRTEETNPELDFRYASDDLCYCSEHLPGRQKTAVTDKVSP